MTVTEQQPPESFKETPVELVMRKARDQFLLQEFSETPRNLLLTRSSPPYNLSKTRPYPPIFPG